MFTNSSYTPWQKIKYDDTIFHFKGDKESAKKVLSSSKNISSILTTLQKLDRYSSGVIETKTHIIAWVDHIRSWPLFYTIQNKKFSISPNAYKIKKKISGTQFNEINLIEFKLSGYVTGSETLIQDLSSINPGEFLIWHKEQKKLEISKYFSYIPNFNREIPQENAIKKQDELLNSITKRIINEANGRPIWIPLSGGLDSRILLCKLHEHGYKNIETFTYGPRLNFEGLIAKKIANKLDVNWRFVSVPKKIAKQYFNDENRKEFFKFSGNLKTIPCMREYSAIRYLHETDQIDKDAIFLNGQSGDYITGGHISESVKNKPDYNQNNFYDVIIDKHYDLWKQFKTEKNISIIKNKINNLIKQITGTDININTPLDGAKHEEIWEYEGRQICYVVNGQRIYEYFGYDWEMPLWEKSLVDFYQPLTFDMKYAQKIYKDYLQSYNYKGLFPKKERYIWRWPILMLWVVPVAQIIGLIAGRKKKDNFYAKMRYWGHYANQYRFFSKQQHFATSKNARSIISLYVPAWLRDHGLDL